MSNEDNTTPDPVEEFRRAYGAWWAERQALDAQDDADPGSADGFAIERNRDDAIDLLHLAATLLGAG